MSKKRDAEVLDEFSRVRELLDEFGLRLVGFDPGVSARFKERPEASGNGYFGEPVTLDGGSWAWLRPVLEELKARRVAERERRLGWEISYRLRELRDNPETLRINVDHPASATLAVVHAEALATLGADVEIVGVVQK